MSSIFFEYPAIGSGNCPVINIAALSPALIMVCVFFTFAISAVISVAFAKSPFFSAILAASAAHSSHSAGILVLDARVAVDFIMSTGAYPPRVSHKNGSMRTCPIKSCLAALRDIAPISSMYSLLTCSSAAFRPTPESVSSVILSLSLGSSVVPGRSK